MVGIIVTIRGSFDKPLENIRESDTNIKLIW